MDRILILSYHHPPLNVIASYRSRGYEENLPKFGIYPIIVTHQWEQDGDGWKAHLNPDQVSVEEYHTHTIIRLPRYQTLVGRVVRRLGKIRFMNRFIILFSWIFGFPDSDFAESYDSYWAYRRFLRSYLSEHRVNCLMGIFSPHHHIRLLSWISRSSGIPFIIDFRDTWNNRLINASGSYSLRDRIIAWYWRKWMKNMAYFTTVSEPYVTHIARLINRSGHRIMHGYDSDLDLHREPSADPSFFTILYPGSMYPSPQMEEDLTILVDGLEQFKSSFPDAKWMLVFVGTYYDEWLRKALGDRIQSENLLIVSKRQEREIILDWYRKSSLLFLPSYRGYPGTYSGKLFEYLGVGKNIMVIPSDNGVIEDLVNETRTGVLLNTSEEVTTYVREKYDEWRKTGRPHYDPNREALGYYSRENQVRLWVEKYRQYQREKSEQA